MIDKINIFALLILCIAFFYIGNNGAGFGYLSAFAYCAKYIIDKNQNSHEDE